MKLFVAGIPYDFDDVDLKEMFELYGVVNSAKIVMDRETGKSKGFGFVDMPDDTEARQAIETLDNASIRGKKMAVKEADEQIKAVAIVAAVAVITVAVAVVMIAAAAVAAITTIVRADLPEDTKTRIQQLPSKKHN